MRRVEEIVKDGRKVHRFEAKDEDIAERIMELVGIREVK